MTLDELLLNVRGSGFESTISQTMVKTEEDKETFSNRGFFVPLTENEFRATFPGIDPKHILYTTAIGTTCLYFNKETLAAAPFHIEIFLNPSGSGTFTADKAAKAIAEREQEVARGQYLYSVMSLTDAMQIQYFKLAVEKGVPIPNLYQLFMYVYNEADYGFNSIGEETLSVIWESKTEEDKAKTKAKAKDLPDVLTIYRGGNTESTPHESAYSWTLDLNVANFFACRRGRGPGYIAKGQVRKEDVIEFLLDDRGEDEVVVNPAKVTDLEVIQIDGLDYLTNVLPEVVPMYHKYRDMMCKQISFLSESEIHGKQHQARVLLLSLLLAHKLGLPAADQRVLATAAIYHDSQRDTDWEDEQHGRASKEYYSRVERNPDPFVEFLIEYHCLPDEEGLAHIRENRKLSKNRSRAEKLFKVFKDADGLDRVRLGDMRHELDLNQLRFEESKRMTLVARLCLEQLKV